MVILLPVPLAPTAVSLGQLLSVPGDASSASFLPSSTPEISKGGETQTTLQSRYEGVVLQDDQGRLLSRQGKHPPYAARDHLVLIRADEIQYTSLKHPSTSFDALRRDPAVQTFLCRMGLRNRPLYYVVGVQKVKKPSFRHAIVKDGVAVEDPSFKNAPGATHVRRDSGTALQDESSTDLIIGLELRKVKARVGSADEPHAIGDIDYSWTYHTPDADKDVQLSVGLGMALNAGEQRALADSTTRKEGQVTDDSGGSEDSSGGEGSAGF